MALKFMKEHLLEAVAKQVDRYTKIFTFVLRVIIKFGLKSVVNQVHTYLSFITVAKNIYNREYFQMACSKQYFMNEDVTIMRVCSMSILFIFMFYERCFTFVMHHFVSIIIKISPYLPKEWKNYL